MACLWSALIGATEFVCLIAASADRAQNLLETIKVWLETNDLLNEDFPEVTVPVRALDRITNRQKGQKHNGIATPANCRSGICGWCHSRLVSGNVYVPKEVDGRRMADLQYGYVHPCSTFPLSDIEIDVPPFRL
jgi:succinate dehydrogenase/fumarate reductase-like Fe-S protein